MNDPKAAVQEKIESEVVEATAMVVSPEVAKISQTVMQEEIEAGHLKSMGMMAIENAIDEDKSVYETQLDEVRVAVEKKQQALIVANRARDSIIKGFKDQLIRT